MTTDMPQASAVETTLPHSPLSFAGVSASQQDFLVALYVGAFSRAPEFDGLKFWAGALANQITYGANADVALQDIGRAMYQAGAQNGEGGTQLSTRDYVSFAYQNSLGREPDEGGFNFWVEVLESGQLQRGDFLATFLSSALDNPTGDSQFLNARITVAEYMAQEHVSGPGAPGLDAGFLKSTLLAVTDEQSARKTIGDILQQYGEGNGSVDLPGAGHDGIAFFSGTIGVAETWSMNFEGYRKFEILDFTPGEDRLFFGGMVLDEVIYLGEPRSYEDMFNNYFTGVPGQAALNRSTSELIVDVNGDGKYSAAEDLLITLVGVYQLEDSDLTS
ncbi:DUF4214 domain-containing protein [Pseudomonas sp. GWSMS-1]|uniref:DUF4214 domain-containing protein n=1 Tax=Pseudomonas sp. GWSMS-1 TaxID=3308997 RepID=UPI003CE795E5